MELKALFIPYKYCRKYVIILYIKNSYVCIEREKIKIKFNHSRLWKSLIDKNIKKKDFIDKTTTVFKNA